MYKFLHHVTNIYQAKYNYTAFDPVAIILEMIDFEHSFKQNEKVCISDKPW